MRYRLYLGWGSTVLGVFLSALCVISNTARAADVQITCTPPVSNEDGTPITAAQGPLTFNLYGGLQGATKQKLVTGATSCLFTRTGVAFGTQEYQTTAVALGVESKTSNVASIVIPPPVPGSPTNAKVLQLVAYEMRGSIATKNLRMVSVGYAAEGTECLATKADVGGVVYQQVDKSKVDLYNAVEKLPPVTWARCG